MKCVQLALATAWIFAVLAGQASAQVPIWRVSRMEDNPFLDETEPSPSNAVRVEDAEPEFMPPLPPAFEPPADYACYVEACDPSLRLFSTDWNGLNFGGWTQIGFHNKQSIADGFFDYPDRVAVHQQWLYAEKAADGALGMDWGFRFDAVYGIDANNTQAFGNPRRASGRARWDYATAFEHGPYGWALPQAYAELAVGDLSIIGGHFYTSIGYEVVPAPDNFFYSHAYTMNHSEPFTHTGFLATYQVSDQLKVYGGWTAGWDTGFDQFGSGSNFLGGFSYALTPDIDFTYMTTIGDFGWIGRDAYMQSLVLEVQLTESWEYVFQSDLLAVGAPTGEGVSDSFGINQYLFYTLDDCWAFGGRVEWYKPEGISGYQAGVGVNYRPHSNVVLRPEVRQEWAPGAGLDQTVFGIDAVLTY